MEMSMLCGQDVNLVIHDRRKSKFVIFRSTDDFDSKKVDYLENALNDNALFETWTNKGYEELCGAKIVTC